MLLAKIKARLWDLPWKKVFDMSGWTVGLVALIVGVIHVRELKQTTHELTTFEDKFSHDTKAIKDSLSTQFEGQFPDFLPDLLKTASEAQRELVIVCDFPAYADFSAPTIAMNLRHIIKTKSNSVFSVKITCLSSKSRVAALHERINRATFDRSLEDAAVRRRLLQYIVESGVPRTAVVYDDFIAAIEENNRMALRQVFGNAEVRTTDDDIPIFFWIIDGHKGMMVVPTPAGRVEYGFRTSDSSLIEALLAARSRYKISSP